MLRSSVPTKHYNLRFFMSRPHVSHFVTFPLLLNGQKSIFFLLWLKFVWWQSHLIRQLLIVQVRIFTVSPENLIKIITKYSLGIPCTLPCMGTTADSHWWLTNGPHRTRQRCSGPVYDCPSASWLVPRKPPPAHSVISDSHFLRIQTMDWKPDFFHTRDNMGYNVSD